jgi:hypothetical protein
MRFRCELLGGVGLRIEVLAGSPSIVGDRWLAVHQNDELRLFEINGLEHAVLMVPRVVSYHLLPDHLVTHDLDDMITCWKINAGEWRETARWPWAPAVPVDESERPDQEVLLSPSGRHLLRERAVWDAGSGAHRYQVSGNADFVQILDGSTGVIADMGPFEIPGSRLEYLEYAATSDGQLIVVRDRSQQATGVGLNCKINL